MVKKERLSIGLTNRSFVSHQSNGSSTTSVQKHHRSVKLNNIARGTDYSHQIDVVQPKKEIILQDNCNKDRFFRFLNNNVTSSSTEGRSGLLKKQFASLGGNVSTGLSFTSIKKALGPAYLNAGLDEKAILNLYSKILNNTSDSSTAIDDVKNQPIDFSSFCNFMESNEPIRNIDITAEGRARYLENIRLIASSSLPKLTNRDVENLNRHRFLHDFAVQTDTVSNKKLLKISLKSDISVQRTDGKNIDIHEIDRISLNSNKKQCDLLSEIEKDSLVDASSKVCQKDQVCRKRIIPLVEKVHSSNSKNIGDEKFNPSYISPQYRFSTAYSERYGPIMKIEGDSSYFRLRPGDAEIEAAKRKLRQETRTKILQNHEERVRLSSECEEAKKALQAMGRHKGICTQRYRYLAWIDSGADHPSQKDYVRKSLSSAAIKLRNGNGVALALGGS